MARTQGMPWEVPRPRVAELLAGAWRRPLTLIAAEAGYGKTTALRQLAATGPARYVTLTPACRDADALAALLAHAVDPRGSHPDVADLADLADLAAELVADGEDTLLVIDEAEHIAGHTAEAATATALLSRLVRSAPGTLHVVAAGRQVPHLDVDHREPLRITAPDLAGTVDETSAMLERRLGPIDPELAHRCWSATDGWPAVVGLLADRLARDGTRTSPREHRWASSWRDFVEGVLADQPASSLPLLRAAAAVSEVDHALLAASGAGATPTEYARLIGLGLLRGEPRETMRLAAPLREAAAAIDDPAGATGWRTALAGALEAAGRLREALDCHAVGSAELRHAFLRRQGHRLVEEGAAGQVVEVLREVGTGADADVETVLADALWLSGDWDGAVEHFGQVERRCGDSGLPAAAAWRFGALLYLRGDTARASAVLATARAGDERSADDARVSAWLASVLWSRGRTEDASALAELALKQADACADPRARAVAYVARALVCASEGDRDGNARAYRAALAAATAGGDTLQAARIHANLASRAFEEGYYEEAIRQADRAVEVGAGHRLFTGLALANKAQALLRQGNLDLARAAAAESVEEYAAASSLLGCTAQLTLGEVYRQRGDKVQARLCFEAALRAAEQADDAHVLVAACVGLAWVRAGVDDEDAARHAARAWTEATGLERAGALAAGAWVELRRGDRAAARATAERAEAQGRANGDRAALAAALELQAAAQDPPHVPGLHDALSLWREIGDPIATARAELAVATLAGDQLGAALARRDLTGFGAAADVGVTGLLCAAGTATQRPAITTLGRFTVTVDGQPVPPGAWQSHKARDLLKLLTARAGRPITRDAAAEQLWPGQDRAALGARLSVLLTRLRTVLDPNRCHPADHYLAADRRSVYLRTDRLSIDVVQFLAAAADGAELMSAGRSGDAELRLRVAEDLYAGDFLEDDPYADWAVNCREQARAAAMRSARLLARAAARRGADEEAARWLLRLLERDPYDEDAWTALIAAQVRLRRHGEARHHYGTYVRRMAELDITPAGFEALADRQP